MLYGYITMNGQQNIKYDILCMIPTRRAQHFCWRRNWPWPVRF